MKTFDSNGRVDAVKDEYLASNRVNGTTETKFIKTRVNFSGGSESSIFFLYYLTRILDVFSIGKLLCHTTLILIFPKTPIKGIC